MLNYSRDGPGKSQVSQFIGDRGMSKLLEILKHHQGRDRAITAKKLATKLNHDERFVRLKIRDLIAQGIPIASNTQIPHGYYIVETILEANQYMQSLRNRLIEDALRRRDFKRARDKAFYSGEQARLL